MVLLLQGAEEFCAYLGLTGGRNALDFCPRGGTVILRRDMPLVLRVSPGYQEMIDRVAEGKTFQSSQKRFREWAS
jgi:hypothetical protein